MKSPKALVFCSDGVPADDVSTSGGGLRSFQIMQLLRDLGIQVSFATPEMYKAEVDPIGFNFLGAYNLENQEEILAKDDFGMVWWCNPGTVDSALCKKNSGLLRCVDFHGPTNLETVFVTGESLEQASVRIAGNLKYIDVRTFVSETQRSYWMGFLSGAGQNPTQTFGRVINLSIPLIDRRYEVGDTVRFVFVGGWHPWLVDEESLLHAATTIEGERNAELHFLGGAHSFCEQRYEDLAKKLNDFESVTLHGFLPHRNYIEFMQNSSCALDLFSDSYERRIAISTRTVEFVSCGIPMLHPSWSELGGMIKETRCGWTYSDLKGLGERIRYIARNPSVLRKASNSSILTHSQYFNTEKAKGSMREALRPWAENNKIFLSAPIFAPRIQRGAYDRLSVLWVTFIPDGQALRCLRVEAVLMSLYEAGVLNGFGILSGGSIKLVGETESFDVVCVQREGTNNAALRELIFKDHFVLDIDDLLFVKASYRAQGFDRWMDTHYDETLELIKRCSILSVTSSRLAELLETVLQCDCLSKCRTTPNGLLFPRSLSNLGSGTAQAMIWTSSDFAALDQSKEDVLEACASFCRDKNLPVYLFGQFSKELLNEFSSIRTFGMIDFHHHKQMLDRLGGRVFGVAPLETNTDQSTLDFIAGKSDLKMVEYGGYGIETVYSSSPPYLETDLMNRHIVNNNFEEWRIALQSAYERPSIPLNTVRRIREKRDISRISLECWLPLLVEARRENPLGLKRLQTLFDSHAKQPLIKRVWTSCVPRPARRVLDPILQPIFG
jgi:hypothetical protein